MSSGDARWCSQHKRLECVHQRSRGRGQCHGPAVKGTAACRLHSGKTVARARRDALRAWAATPGQGDGITPIVAVSGQLALSWHRAAMLGELLREQAEAEGSCSLAGPLAAAEAAERDRVVKYAVVAHQMGVQDHWISVARKSADALVATLDGIFADLELSPAQRERVPEVVPARLRAMRLDDDGDDAA